VTLYLDSSALAKLYVEEDGTDTVHDAIKAHRGAVVLSVLTLPEVTHAVTRTARNLGAAEETVREMHRRILEDWDTLERIPVMDHIAKEASMLARSKGLRGADAVQLATCALLSRERRGVQFLGFDDALNEAAKTVVRLWEAK
jgi:uncharacterized protein